MGFFWCLREIVHGLDGVGWCGSLGKGDHGGIHASVALVLGCRVSIRGWCCMMCIIRGKTMWMSTLGCDGMRPSGVYGMC